MENIKIMLGLDPTAPDSEVEQKIKDLLAKQSTADAEKAEANMAVKAAEFAKKHGAKFEDVAAATAFFRASPEHAVGMVGKFRKVESVEEHEEAELTRKAGEFAKTHGAKFEDEASAIAFYRAAPEQADALVLKIRVATVAHRKGGHPDGEEGSMTASAAHSKWSAMPEGAKKEEFFDANTTLINEGAPQADS